MAAAAPLSVSLSGRRGTFSLDVAFDLAETGVTGLFGPSGSGKTTVLRAIAGLEHLDGRISAGGDVWLDSVARIERPPHTRAVGYVFQEPSLFAHLPVRANLPYGASRRPAGRTSRPEFDEIVAALGLAPLLDRDTSRLSGGERQRVAIGRALLSAPSVLLMDEPLAALDAPSKVEILAYLERLLARLRLPVLYVTHDADELHRLADHVVLLENGRVVRSDTEAARLHGRLVAMDESHGLARVTLADGGDIWVAAPAGSIGDACRVWIDPRRVSLAPVLGAPAAFNTLAARITHVEARDGAPEAEVRLALGREGTGARITALLLRPEVTILGLEPGLAVTVRIGHARATVVPVPRPAPR